MQRVGAGFDSRYLRQPRFEEQCPLTVPGHTGRVSIVIPVPDLEPGYRSLMPVLDFTENGLDVVGY